jgi:hypothetical protein
MRFKDAVRSLTEKFSNFNDLGPALEEASVGESTAQRASSDDAAALSVGSQFKVFCGMFDATVSSENPKAVCGLHCNSAVLHLFSQKVLAKHWMNVHGTRPVPNLPCERTWPIRRSFKACAVASRQATGYQAGASHQTGIGFVKFT